MSRRLIGLIDGDLPDHRLTRRDGAAVFVPDSEGPVLEVGVRVERRFLGRTEIARFQTVTPAPGWGPGRLTVRHTGRLSREGVDVRVEEGSEAAEGLADTLRDDPELAASAVRLDFTRFDIDLDGESCRVTVELMGGSLVSIALPPIRSYVRLHDDQREALLASLQAVARVVAAAGPARDGPGW